MSKIKIGVIGAGFIAEKHLEVLVKFKNVSIIAITSRTKTKAIKLAKKYKVKNISDNPNDLIRNYKPHGILVLVSAEQIYNVTKKLIKFKIPLFIEKPAGLNFNETKKLVNINSKYKTRTMIGYNRRFYSIFHKGLKKIHEKGKLLGIIIEGHERFWKLKKLLNNNICQNWLYANSTHTIDLLRFFGGEIKNKKIFKKNLIEKKGDQFGIIVEFKNGAIGHYISHWYSPGGWSVKLFGEGITVEFKPLENGFYYNENMKIKKISPFKKDLDFKSGLYAQMEAFVKFIIEGKKYWPLQSLEDTFETVKITKDMID